VNECDPDNCGRVQILQGQVDALAQALRFYGYPANWQTPSSGFATQYDPEPPAAERDGGQRARLTLESLKLYD